MSDNRGNPPPVRLEGQSQTLREEEEKRKKIMFLVDTTLTVAPKDHFSVPAVAIG